MQGWEKWDRAQRARFVLWHIAGLGAARLAALDALTAGAPSLWGSRSERAAARSALGRAAIEADRRASEDLEEAFARQIAALGPSDTVLARDDPGYPRALLDLRRAPPFLFVRGELSALAAAPKLAVVGSRRAPARISARLRSWCEALGRSGAVIVSGGALGLDAAAHRGALDGGAPTLVVLPSGLDRPAPPSHAALFGSIAARGGALVTEYPHGVSARAYHFRRRNELVAALARAVLIARAAERSGTMLTAEAAIAIGRDLLVVPYEPWDEGGAGSASLLAARRARSVRGPEDALRALGLMSRAPSREPLRVDAARAASLWGCTIAEARARLVELELSRAARTIAGTPFYLIEPP